MSSETANGNFLHIPRRALIASLLFDLLLPTSWLTVKGLEYLGVKIFPSTHVKDIYQEYVQVDLVGLPDVAVKDLEALDATLPETVTAPRMETKPHDAETDLMELESTKKAAVAKAQAEKAKQAAKAEEEKKKALKQIEEEMKREAALKALAEKEGKKGRLKSKVISSPRAQAW